MILSFHDKTNMPALQLCNTLTFQQENVNNAYSLRYRIEGISFHKLLILHSIVLSYEYYIHDKSRMARFNKQRNNLN